MSVKHQTSHIPLFTGDHAAHIASSLYGLQAEVHSLAGERDYNFHLQSTTGAAFVLKIAHADEQKEMLALQNEALAHLVAHDPTLLLPQVCSTVTGESIATSSAPDGTERFVRLLTYIPGRLLAETHPHTPELLSSLGTMLGRFDRGLQDFTHLAAQRTLKWDVRQAEWIRDYLH
nr:phosphotransferase [Ktedonobacteraceae bacterium]